MMLPCYLQIRLNKAQIVQNSSPVSDPAAEWKAEEQEWEVWSLTTILM